MIVHLKLPFEEVSVRSMTDSKEETVDCNVELLFVRFALETYEMCSLNTVITEESNGIGVI